MAVLVVIRNLVAVAAFVSLAALLVWTVTSKLVPSVKRALDKVAELHDVEMMDDAEILARKYKVGKKGKGKGGKGNRNA